jgi:hypothetical protein
VARLARAAGLAPGRTGTSGRVRVRPHGIQHVPNGIANGIDSSAILEGHDVHFS